MITEVLSEPGRFGPTPADSLTIGRICPGCGTPIRAGDVPALVNGAPADDEDIAAAAAGLPHTVEAQIAHEDCAATAARHQQGEHENAH